MLILQLGRTRPRRQLPLLQSPLQLTRNREESPEYVFLLLLVLLLFLTKLTIRRLLIPVRFFVIILVRTLFCFPFDLNIDDDWYNLQKDGAASSSTAVSPPVEEEASASSSHSQPIHIDTTARRLTRAQHRAANSVSPSVTSCKAPINIEFQRHFSKWS